MRVSLALSNLKFWLAGSGGDSRTGVVVSVVLVEGLGRIGQPEGARSFVPTPLEHRQHCHITIIIIISATTR